MFVYGLYVEVDAYEGADYCVGIYDDYVKVRQAELRYEAMYEGHKIYVSKIELNKDEFGASKGIFGVDDLITKKFKIDISFRRNRVNKKLVRFICMNKKLFSVQLIPGRV